MKMMPKQHIQFSVEKSIEFKNSDNNEITHSSTAPCYGSSKMHIRFWSWLFIFSKRKLTFWHLYVQRYGCLCRKEKRTNCSCEYIMLQLDPVLSLQAKLAKTEPRNAHVIDNTRPTIDTNNVDVT